MIKLSRPFIWILILAVFLTSMPLTVSATPQTHPNTHVNTGDQRKDIVAIALTQVGYYEGYNNDTKYGVWYGYNNLAWCGIFVAWCANQAGVPTSVLARTGIANPYSYGLTPEPAGYIPQSGDLFFTPTNSHVGIVYYVEGDYFYSIEGNTWTTGPEGVYICKHKLSSMVFASPNYQGGGEHDYVLETEDAHPHKEYYRCTHCGDKYYSGKNGSRADCTACIQASCNHSYSPWAKTSDSRHGRSCSLCGKQESGDHSWNGGNVTKQPTCAVSGTKIQSCTLCGASRTVTLAKTTNHSYSDWKSEDDTNHVRTCSVCFKTEKQAHDLGGWQTEEDGHWMECSVCEGKVKNEEHTFGKECDSPCEICKYTRPDGHQFSDTWLTDDNSHWVACSVCELRKDESDHDFSADCDESCDICGYTRTTVHSFADVWFSDGKNHWHACTVCGQTRDLEAHNGDQPNRPGAMVYCNTCSVALVSDAAHTHGYDEVFSDQSSHWGSCSCGNTMESQFHIWSVKTDTCSVCGQAKPPTKEHDYSELIVWACAAGGLVLVGILLIALLLRKTKKSAVV